MGNGPRKDSLNVGEDHDDEVDAGILIEGDCWDLAEVCIFCAIVPVSAVLLVYNT